MLAKEKKHWHYWRSKSNHLEYDRSYYLFVRRRRCVSCLHQTRRSTSAGHRKTPQCIFKSPLRFHLFTLQQNKTLGSDKSVFCFSLFAEISFWWFCAATVTTSLWISQPTKDSNHKNWSWSWLFMWNYNPGALLLFFFVLFFFITILISNWRLTVSLSVRQSVWVPVPTCLTRLSICLSVCPFICGRTIISTQGPKNAWKHIRI